MKRNLNGVLLFICLLCIDLIFYLIAFSSLSFYALGRMLLIDIALAALFSFLLSKTNKKIAAVMGELLEKVLEVKSFWKTVS